MEYIHLVGVEQIQNAANVMKSAAELMQRAANTIEYALQRHDSSMKEFMSELNNTTEEWRKGEGRP